MDGSIIQLDIETEKTMRRIFSVPLSDDDLEWTSEWLITVGIGFVRHVISSQSGMTLGKFIFLTTQDIRSENSARTEA
jgi:hypothetical protein